MESQGDVMKWKGKENSQTVMRRSEMGYWLSKSGKLVKGAVRVIVAGPGRCWRSRRWRSPTVTPVPRLWPNKLILEASLPRLSNQSQTVFASVIRPDSLGGNLDEGDESAKPLIGIKFQFQNISSKSKKSKHITELVIGRSSMII